MRDGERERKDSKGEKNTAKRVHLPPTTTNPSLSAIKSNNNNEIEVGNVATKCTATTMIVAIMGAQRYLRIQSRLNYDKLKWI